MGYKNLRQCVDDLERHGHLVRIATAIDPHLEAAEIQRRVYAAGGPALLFERVKGCQFPMVSNLFGTPGRARFLFRDALASVKSLVALKTDPAAFWRHPLKNAALVRSLWHMLPKKCRRGPILDNETAVEHLPQMVSWPDDGGAFITLPEVYTEPPGQPGLMASNLGMYRVQLSGGSYQRNAEIGLHYQIHRGIGQHHAAAIERGERLPVNIFVGGPPAMILAAVMPLPDNLSELTFAGALGRRRVRMVAGRTPLPILAEADFCITGSIDPSRTLPEGPFGDHLGYYSNAHEFPVMEVEKVFYRKDAIWPFTVVGRPPQEDTGFGDLIHELTGPAIPAVIPGVKAVHAVDAAGVHPLLLAIGSERYAPYESDRRPRELLTIANAILGQGQLSLAKYLWIAAQQDDPGLDLHDIPAFFRHMLERIDFTRDVHFQTSTTIDTLDYSGTGLNAGSKVVLAAAGDVRRTLDTELPSGISLPDGFSDLRVCLPGIVAVDAPAFVAGVEVEASIPRFIEHMQHQDSLEGFPLIVLVDDAEFTARTLNNFLWVTFTRSNPAADIHGLNASTYQKHWGCRGSLVIDARIKPHHAAPLVEDPEVVRRVDSLATSGGPLHGVF